MLHWQWFLLAIIFSFVISNTETRRNWSTIQKHKPPKLGQDVADYNPWSKYSSAQARVTTNIKFPLWVLLPSISSVGAETQFEKIAENEYDIRLPFFVHVDDENVLYNVSAAQEKKLSFPMWVQIDDVGGKSYANGTADARLRVKFPYRFEVEDMRLTDPSTDPEFHGVIPVMGIAAGMAAAVVGGVILTLVMLHVISAAVPAVIRAAVEMLNPIPVSLDGYSPKKSITRVGNMMMRIVGNVVSIVPFIDNRIRGRISHIFQTIGDNFCYFVGNLFTFRLLGDLKVLINVVFSILVGIPCFSKLTGYKVFTTTRPGESLSPNTPPLIVFPPTKPPHYGEKIIIIIIPGQIYIPEIPSVCIVWPGQQPIPGKDPIYPPQTLIPYFPQYVICWPGQSPISQRPNVIIIIQGQKTVSGHKGVLIVWPGDPEPHGTNLIIVRPGTSQIPGVNGIVLKWPGWSPTESGPFYIIIEKEQRQVPGFPDIVIVWPGDPVPYDPPGLVILHPGEKNIPGYPSIILLWPGSFPPNEVMTINIYPADRQVPGIPYIVILYPGERPPVNDEEYTYIQPGTPCSSSLPWIVYHWSPETTYKAHSVQLFIPSGAKTIPTLPQCRVIRSESPSDYAVSGQCSIKVGDRTLPIPYPQRVVLIWLELVSELVVTPNSFPAPNPYPTVPSSVTKKSIQIIVSSHDPTIPDQVVNLKVNCPPGSETQTLFISGRTPVSGISPDVQLTPGLLTISGQPSLTMLIPGQKPVTGLPPGTYLTPYKPSHASQHCNGNAEG